VGSTHNKGKKESAYARLREQGILFDQSCPADICHPEFNLGCPVYFDLSVSDIFCFFSGAA